MINVSIRSNGNRRTDVVDVSTSPFDVFEKAGIDSTRTAVYLDGTLLAKEQIYDSFEELEISDGASIVLSAIVKADGGAYSI